VAVSFTPLSSSTWRFLVQTFHKVVGVATRLQCGWIFDKRLTANFVVSLPVRKNFMKID